MLAIVLISDGFDHSFTPFLRYKAVVLEKILDLIHRHTKSLVDNLGRDHIRVLVPPHEDGVELEQVRLPVQTLVDYLV